MNSFGDHLLEWPAEFLFWPDNEENVQADHGAGGSLSLSTSPHRRSLEALGLLHNSGDHVGFNRDVGDNENVSNVI